MGPRPILQIPGVCNFYWLMADKLLVYIHKSKRVADCENHYMIIGCDLEIT